MAAAAANGGSSSSNNQCVLWTGELGARFVTQYHQYLQQQLQGDSQSDGDDVTTRKITRHITDDVTDQGDIEQGYFTPAGSTTYQSYGSIIGPTPSAAVMQQQSGVMLLPQRQQHLDFRQQQQQQQRDFGFGHGSHEKLTGVWRAVLGGVLGLRHAGRGFDKSGR